MNFCHFADWSTIPPNENIAKITVDQYFTGSRSTTRARQDLEQGRLLDRCGRCYETEQNGLLSNRQRRNLQAAIFPGKDFLPSVNEAWPRINSWHKPKFYHISLSNLCNMACMMCSPEWSSSLTSTQQRAGVLDIRSPVLRDWTQDDGIWNSFVEHLLGNRDIVCLHFMGGEPLYHKRFWQLIDILVEQDHCDFALTFVTNGSILINNTRMTKLKRFRNVVIEISIESLDSSNDYIRYPSKYHVMQANITQYLGYRTHNLSVVLRTVPQLLSAARYDRLLDFALQHDVMIDNNVLFAPAFLACNVLPIEIKQDVIKKLSKFVQHQTTGAKDINLRDSTDLERSISLHVERVIGLINIPCPDPEEKWQALVQYCKKMDAIRKIDVTEMVPDLAEHFIQRGYFD